MSHVPHEVAQEFPGHAARLHALKIRDGSFARLLDDYRQVHRIETCAEFVSQDTEQALRRLRMRIKHEIADRLSRSVQPSKRPSKQATWSKHVLSRTFGSQIVMASHRALALLDQSLLSAPAIFTQLGEGSTGRLGRACRRAG